MIAIRSCSTHLASVRALARDQRGGTDFVEYLCLLALVVMAVGLGVRAYGESVDGSFDDGAERVAKVHHHPGGLATMRSLSGTADHADGPRDTTRPAVPEAGAASGWQASRALRAAIDVSIAAGFGLIVLVLLASLVARRRRRRAKRAEHQARERAARLSQIVQPQGEAAGSSGPETRHDVADLPSVIVAP